MAILVAVRSHHPRFGRTLVDGPNTTKTTKRLRRAFMWTVIIVAALIALWAGLCGVERRRGTRVWNTYRMSAVARGARLGIEDLRAPAIPDAENFAAVPIFQNLFVEAKAGTSAPKPFAALKMEGYRPPESKGSRQPLIPDLPSWRDHFVVRGVIPEATEDVGADVLRALQAVEPELAQLREAGQRPHSRFPVDAQLGVEAPVPHLTPILTAARAYHLAIAAHHSYSLSPGASSSRQWIVSSGAGKTRPRISAGDTARSHGPRATALSAD